MIAFGRNERDERELALSMADAMMEKLSQNRDKGGWQNCPVAWLLERMHEEVAELVTAISDRASVDDVRGEAADVANFLAMIVDNYSRAVKP